MGTSGNGSMSHEELLSSEGHKPTLFERFKLWRATPETGQGEGHDGAAADRPGELKTSKELAAESARQRTRRSTNPEGRLADDFRDAFSARLDAMLKPADGRPAPSAPAAAPSASPNAARLGQLAGQSQLAIDELNEALERLAETMAAVRDGVAEGNHRGGEMKEVFAVLPEVVQTLPAIGRGQLSILSGMAAEQRAIGINVAERIDAHADRTLDAVRAIESVEERTQEVVRSVDELREVLVSLPAGILSQAEVLDEMRRTLSGLDQQLAAGTASSEQAASDANTAAIALRERLEDALAMGFSRQEEVLVEGFVNQTVALEGIAQAVGDLKSTMTALADRLQSAQHAAPQPAPATAESSGLLVDGETLLATDAPSSTGQPAAERPATAIALPWRQIALSAAAGLLVVVVGIGSVWYELRRPQPLATEAARMVEALGEDRALLTEQITTLQSYVSETTASSERERSEALGRLADLMEMNEKLMREVDGLRSDNALLMRRNTLLANENLALRQDSKGSGASEPRADAKGN